METAFIGLDPLYSTNIKIFTRHIHQLKRSENKSFELYHFYGHLIKLVDICGIIVGVERNSSNIIYTLDDGSGTISCYLWEDDIKNGLEILELGTLVRVLGKIHTFNEEKIINVQDILKLNDPNEEVAHWIQTITLENQYRKSYELPGIFEDNKGLLLNRLDSDYLVDELNRKEEMFLIAVYNFLLLNSPSIPFPTSLLQQDKELVELAKNTISPKTPSKRKIIQLFEKTFMIICKKGLAQSSVSRPGMYELIDPMTLTEFIISIVSKALENINTDMGGVRLDYIKTRVSEKFKYLNYNDVSKVIDDLCCKGILYCCGDKEYKLLMPVQH